MVIEVPESRADFYRLFDEAVTATDLVELMCETDDELEEMAKHADIGPDGLFVHRGPLLEYHWMHREVFTTYGKELWAIGQELAVELGDANVLKMLAYRTEPGWVRSWDDLIDQFVTRVLAFIAGGMQGEDE